MYDAVNAIKGSHQPYLDGIEASPRASKRAAVATAAHDVLVGLVPQLPQVIRDRLDLFHATSLAAIRNGPRKRAGVAVGADAAAAMLADRADDGRFGSFTFTPGVKALGAASGSTRTTAQTVLALFYTDNPVLQSNRAFRTIARIAA